MRKKSAEDYLDKLLNSVNDERERKDKFKETAKMIEDARSIFETQGSKLIFEEPEEEPPYEEKKSAQEDFLDALLSGAKDTEFGMNRKRPDTNPMYSRRVSKSEADFLKEFEAELLDGEDDLLDIFEDFTKAAEPEDRVENETVQEETVEPQQSFELGDMDLSALVNEVADVMSSTKPEESVPEESVLEEASLLDMIEAEPSVAQSQSGDAAESIPMDADPIDVFENFFGSEDSGSVDDANPSVGSEGIDLGNLGEEDLMNLLAGTDGLEDIGNLLSNSDATELPLDEMDAFTVFAESEMSAQQISAESAIEEEIADKKGKKGAKIDLLGKLKGIIGSFLKDEEEDGVEIKAAKAPTAEALAGENADILAELEALDEKPSKKDKKNKKEKKPKKAKATKAPKAKKPPKPKKEKKPKVVDNTPPLPKGPVIMIWIMVGSLVALVLLGVNLIKYNTPVANAKSLQNQGHYAEAFNQLVGLEIKEKDMEMYNQLAVLATVDSEINAYEVFEKAGKVDKAFDSLICAAGRCYINEEEAEVYGCSGQLEIMKKAVSTELEQKYNMTYEEALEMYKIRHRNDYTIALYKKLTELGIEWD